MAFQAEFRAVGESTFHSNALVFATEKEAEAYARDLFSRWMGAEEYRVVETDKKVTYKINLETREMSEV